VVSLPPARALYTLGRHVVGMTRTEPGVDRLRELGAPASTADAIFTLGNLRSYSSRCQQSINLDQHCKPRHGSAEILQLCEVRAMVVV